MLRALCALLAFCAAACAAEEPTCKWSWYYLGCVPKESCQHKMKIRLGKFGDCVPRAAANSSSTEPEAAPELSAEPEASSSDPAPEAAAEAEVATEGEAAAEAPEVEEKDQDEV